MSTTAWVLPGALPGCRRAWALMPGCSPSSNMPRSTLACSIYAPLAAAASAKRSRRGVWPCSVGGALSCQPFCLAASPKRPPLKLICRAPLVKSCGGSVARAISRPALLRASVMRSTRSNNSAWVAGRLSRGLAKSAKAKRLAKSTSPVKSTCLTVTRTCSTAAAGAGTRLMAGGAVRLGNDVAGNAGWAGGAWSRSRLPALGVVWASAGVHSALAHRAAVRP